MARDELSRQEQQINLMMENIEALTGGKFSAQETAEMIREIIAMREKGETEEQLRDYISSKAVLEKNNEKVYAILAEIAEKPFQNKYRPFKNNLLDQLKKDLEKE